MNRLANDVGIFGTIVATTVSYVANHSVLWAIAHGACGWLYVAYHVITR
jgi:hypothetical protein